MERVASGERLPRFPRLGRQVKWGTMSQRFAGRWFARQGIAGCLCLLFATGLALNQASADPPVPLEEALPNVLTRDAAVRWALQYNPELAAFRQQRGIAAAAVLIAETYPFNPLWEAKLQGNSGPASAGITNAVSEEHRVAIDVEIRHQGRYRRQGAYAGLTRTDWEIVFQEETMAIRAIRAFNATLYRRGKLELVAETVTLTEEILKQATDLWKANKGVTRADVIVAQSDVNDARAQIGVARTALVTAQDDLRRVLGLIDHEFYLDGSLALPAVKWNIPALMHGAQEQRADLRARQTAVAEAQARLDLEIANRFGNPNIGPIYTYDPTRVSEVGVAFTLPLPLINTHRGEIQQREAERARAGLDFRQIEITVQQDVLAALNRLRAARAWQQTYEEEVLPRLRDNLKEMRDLLGLGQGGVDVLRVSTVRRSLLRARDGYLDALFEVSQAEADLAAAVGDPSIAIR